MKAIAVFLLFLGTLLVLQGYYDVKMKTSCPEPKTVTKLVPMSIYEQQMSPSESLTTFYKSMFDDIQDWPKMNLVKEAQEDAVEKK